MGPFATKQFNQQINRENSWYEDYAMFVDSNKLWFRLGGAHADGVNSGVFASGCNDAAPSVAATFRIALAPANSVS